MKKLRVPGVLSLAAIALLAGCGDSDPPGDDDDEFVDALASFDCDADTRDEDFFAGMSKTGDIGIEVVLVESTPAPPSRGDNTFTVELRDDEGTLIEGATFEVVPFMPDHNHGTPIDAEVTPHAETPGRYQVTPVNLWMPGIWEVNVELSAPAEQDVVFVFCIPG
jgi:hypothetical protein